MKYKPSDFDNILDPHNCNFTAFEHIRIASPIKEIAGLEKEMYETSMKIYCELMSYKAFKRKYIWPNLEGDSYRETVSIRTS